jgi:hypothetical protein
MVSHAALSGSDEAEAGIGGKPKTTITAQLRVLDWQMVTHSSPFMMRETDGLHGSGNFRRKLGNKRGCECNIARGACCA